jgi:hypothetical protein
MFAIWRIPAVHYGVVRLSEIPLSLSVPTRMRRFKFGTFAAHAEALWRPEPDSAFVPICTISDSLHLNADAKDECYRGRFDLLLAEGAMAISGVKAPSRDRTVVDLPTRT